MVGQRDVQLFLAIERRVGLEGRMGAWSEEGVNLEKRVIAGERGGEDGLKVVGEVKRRVELDAEEGRDVLGRRTRGRVRMLA